MTTVACSVRRRSAGLVRYAGTVAGLLAGVVGCSSIPQSIRTFSEELRDRGSGQYCPLPEELSQQLVLKDAALGCDLDVHSGIEEQRSFACTCTKSSGDWKKDCAEWMRQKSCPAASSAVDPAAVSASPDAPAAPKAPTLPPPATPEP
ncbi:MAG TPA: hypothetical protein VIV60_19785 [Polyangiaceae bacterium]